VSSWRDHFDMKIPVKDMFCFQAPCPQDDTIYDDD
jgi:hypothetical protein